MRSPRQLLAALAVVLATIAAITLVYPPGALGFPWLWSTVTGAAGLTCAAAAIQPRRRVFISASGAAVVTSSAARGIALVAELARVHHEGPGAALWVGACSWWLVALLAYVTWREYVIPWAIGRR